MVTSASALQLGSTPIPRTRLIGREAERATARALVLDEAIPLLTLTGPGGVGKTRLALAVADEVANHFADGVVWIDLAPLADPTLVPLAVATATGVIPAPGRPVETELIRHLQPRQVLLLVDNCEHLLAATAGLMARLLATCPALQVLATSRAPLHIRGEHALPLEPLPVPPATDRSMATLASNEAVRLFVERAHAAHPAFRLEEANASTVAELCRQLDGLPLAIELAAAGSRLLSPETLVTQLGDQLAVLRDGPRDAPARQQTIRAAIRWSYDLLAPGEQTVFRRLAVFSGGFTLDSARAVAGDGNGGARGDIWQSLGALVDQSLVRRLERLGEPRFAMLETIRAFGLERLAEHNEEAATRRRHAAYFLALVRETNAWVAPYLPQAQQILDHLEMEYPNLRSALAWQRESKDVSGLLELGGALFFFWQLRGHLRDGRAWLEWGLAQNVEVSPAARASGQLALSGILYVQHELVPALALCEEALRHYRESGHTAGLARAGDHAACIAVQMDDPDLLATHIDAALADLASLDDAPWARRASSHVRHYRANVALHRGDLVQADRVLRDVAAEQASLAREEGVEHSYAGWPLNLWGTIARLQGAHDDALHRYQAALEHARRVQELRGRAFALAGVAGVLMRLQRLAEAAWLFGATEAFCARSGVAFVAELWSREQHLGLPPSWQRGDAPSAGANRPESRGIDQGLRAPPPILDATDAQFWIAGRSVPIDEAIAAALAVDLKTPGAILPRRTFSATAALPAKHTLSPREQDVFALLCERLTDPQIAARLFLSPRTVEGHVASILGKLGVENRREAVAAAARLSLISLAQREAPAL